MRFSLFTAKRFLMVGIAAVCVAGAGLADASITVNNYAFGIAILSDNDDLSNDSGNFSYASNGDFLLVAVHVTDGGNDASLTTGLTPTVTYTDATNNVATLTSIDISTADNRAQHALFYLKSPKAGTNNITVTWSGDLFTNTNGKWTVSALNLSNVDLDDPIAGYKAITGNGNATETVQSDSPGKINAGDYLLYSAYYLNDTTNPQFQTSEESISNLFAWRPQTREMEITGGTLVSGDLSGTNGDEVVLNRQATRFGDRGVVVFNAIPEPGSLALLGLGSLLMLGRGRRTHRQTR